MSVDHFGPDRRPRHENRGPRKTGCDNEISLVTRLISKGATISVETVTNENPITGTVIWSDLNNICIRSGDGLIWVFPKRNIAVWRFAASEIDG